jgi:NADH dehydrogenase
VIHIFFLIGFRNRFLVMFEWAWSYLTFDRGARLITGTTPAPMPSRAPVAEEENPKEKSDGARVETRAQP